MINDIVRENNLGKTAIFRALMLFIRYPNGKSAGLMELGVPADARKTVYQFAKMVGCEEVNDYAYFTKGDVSLKCRVKYRELTRAGHLRLPSFVEFACLSVTRN